MDNTFNLANTVKVVNPSANVDFYYGVWGSLAEAKSRVPQAVREIGKTVGVIEDSKVVEYWWKEGVADNDLVIKDQFEGIGIKSIFVTASSPIFGESTSVEQQLAFDLNNKNPFTIKKNEIPFFRTTFREAVIVATFQRKDVIQGTYGQGETSIESFQLQIVSKEVISTGSLEGANTETIDAGDIDSQEIWEAVAAETPPYTVQSEDEGFTIFRATQNGIVQAWLYAGDTGQVGAGEYEPTEDDFRSITISEVGDTSKWEEDTATTIRPKGNKKVDAQYIENLPDGYTSTDFDNDLLTKTTDDLEEGNVYLYNRQADLEQVDNSAPDFIKGKATIQKIRTNVTVTKTNDTYTLQASDVDKRLFIPAPCTVIVPNGLAANLEFQGKQTGTGDVEFVAESGGTLNVNAAFQQFTEGEHAYWGIVTLGSDQADLLGTLKLSV